MLFILLLFGLLVVGIYLIIRGIRGVPTLTDPRCARCGYDVRWIQPGRQAVCPECGSALDAPRAVRFGERQSSPRHAIAGVGVILAGVLALFALRLFLQFGGNPPPTALSTPALIQRLPSTASQPWDWQELERRLQAGELAPDSAAATVEALISHLETRPGGWNEPLHWSGNLLSQLDANGAVSDDQMLRLSEAYYGRQGTVTIRGRVVRGQKVPFEIKYGTAWNLPGHKFVKALRRVTLDGQDIEVLEPYGTDRKIDPDKLGEEGSSPIRALLPITTSPGKHTLVFEVDAGMVPEKLPFRTADNKPGQAKRWPKPRASWTSNLTVPIEVLEQGGSSLELVEDPAADPVTKGGLSAEVTLYPAQDGKTSVKVMFRSGKLAVPVVAEASLRFPGREIRLGAVTLLGGGTYGTQIAVPAIPPDVTIADVVLKPDVKTAERDTPHLRIWGREIVLDQLQLQRFDLDDQESTPATRPGDAKTGAAEDNR